MTRIPIIDLNGLSGINSPDHAPGNNRITQIGGKEEKEEAATQRMGHDSSSPQGERLLLTHADQTPIFVCLGKPVGIMVVVVKASAAADQEEIEHGA